MARAAKVPESENHGFRLMQQETIQYNCFHCYRTNLRTLIYQKPSTLKETRYSYFITCLYQYRYYSHFSKRTFDRVG